MAEVIREDLKIKQMYRIISAHLFLFVVYELEKVEACSEAR
jgi:hypothetical protein